MSNESDRICCYVMGHAPTPLWEPFVEWSDSDFNKPGGLDHYESMSRAAFLEAAMRDAKLRYVQLGHWPWEKEEE